VSPEIGRVPSIGCGGAPIATQILLADHHELVRQGVRALLEREGYDVVAEAGDGRDAIRLAQEYRPDLAVLELTMPVLNGIDAGRAIHHECPDVKLIALTEHAEDQFVLDALEAGFRGYVSKLQTFAELVRALENVSRGSVFLSSDISEVVVESYLAKVQPAKDCLTPREREVLQLVAEGKTTKEIARLLGIGAKTGESHRTRIMTKLGIHETAGLVRYAIRRGLIEA
jgi:two-component system response regulator NreC